MFEQPRTIEGHALKHGKSNVIQSTPVLSQEERL